MTLMKKSMHTEASPDSNKKIGKLNNGKKLEQLKKKLVLSKLKESGKFFMLNCYFGNNTN